MFENFYYVASGIGVMPKGHAATDVFDRSKFPVVTSPSEMLGMYRSLFIVFFSYFSFYNIIFDIYHHVTSLAILFQNPPSMSARPLMIVSRPTIPEIISPRNSIPSGASPPRTLFLCCSMA